MKVIRKYEFNPTNKHVHLPKNCIVLTVDKFHNNFYFWVLTDTTETIKEQYKFLCIWDTDNADEVVSNEIFYYKSIIETSGGLHIFLDNGLNCG